MKKIIGLLSCVIIAFILSCQNSSEPNYSIIPYIQLKDFKFVKGDVSKVIADTFKLTFFLRDGDFDLGIRPSDTLAQFTTPFYYNKKLNKFIPSYEIPQNHSDLIVYSDRKTIDTLPPLSCSRWELFYGNTPGGVPIVTDTVYVLQNRNAYNINTDLYYLDANQAWVRFDFSSVYNFPNCLRNPLDGYFEDLSGSASVKNIIFFYRALSHKAGTMIFSPFSLKLYSLFHGKTVKMKFSILDRALHRSNIVETNEILIQ